MSITVKYHQLPSNTLSHPVSHARCPGTARPFSAATTVSRDRNALQTPPLRRRSSRYRPGRGSTFPYHLRQSPRRTRPRLSRDAQDAATTGRRSGDTLIALVTGKQSLPGAAGTGHLGDGYNSYNALELIRHRKRVQNEAVRHITGDTDTGSGDSRRRLCQH